MRKDKLYLYGYTVGTHFSCFVCSLWGGDFFETFCAMNYRRKLHKKFHIVSLLDLTLGKNHCKVSYMNYKIIQAFLANVKNGMEFHHEEHW